MSWEGVLVMPMLHRRYLVLAGTLCMASVMAYDLNRKLEYKEMSEIALEPGVVRALVHGGDQAYPPYEFLEIKGICGFNIDLAPAVAKWVGVDITFQELASMYYSAKLGRSMAFSVPHTLVYQAVFVRDDSTRYRRFGDLKGRRNSVRNGNIMHDYALGYGLGGTRTVTVALKEALAYLALGKVDYRWMGVLAPEASRGWIIKSILLLLAAAALLTAIAIGCIAVFRRQVRKRTAVLMVEANAALEKSRLMTLALMHEASLEKDKLQRTLVATKQSRLAMLSVLEDEKRGADARAQLSAAIEQAAEVILVTDKAGIIQYVNPAFTAITGYTREEAVGQNPSLLKSGRQDAEFYRRMWEKLRSGEVWRGHFINKRKDGTTYEEEASVSPVYDAAKKIVNYVAVKRDVTREIQLEAQYAQAQKMESVGRLAGGVAHDFNNLLMGVMGYAELCRDEIPPDHPIRAWLDQIIQISQRSTEITKQLLAYARKQTVAPKVLNLNDAVDGMLKLLRRLVGEGVTLVWLPGADLSPIKIDPSQVDQILANLCINARDATNGAGKITVETRNVSVGADFCLEHVEALPGNYVLLAVSDNGCGMNAETISKMFEPFYSTKDVSKGTGLGLATVYGIVKQNNGFICATSELSKGTVFKIHLPTVVAEIDETTVPSVEGVPKGRGETILLVEDDPSLCNIYERFLATLGYHVLAAETHGEALKLMERAQNEIVLLLTDVVMPGMDGRQLANRISERIPGIKILFMSGYTADVIAAHGVLEQAVSFIAKPFTRNDLARKVHSILETLDRRRDEGGACPVPGT